MFKKSALFAGASILVLTSVQSAHAACVINPTFVTSSAFGTAADAHPGCSFATIDGAGATSASATIDAYSGSAHSESYANLGTGVLTALSSGTQIYAGAVLWDTFTFANLPEGGALLTSVLSLTGSMSGGGEGDVHLFAGDINTPGNYFSFSVAHPVPASVSFNFLAYNNVAIKIGVELEAFVTGALGAGVADLKDPPTFSVVVPQATTFTSASGVFQNVLPLAAVPEPSSYALLLGGLGVIGSAVRSRSKAMRCWCSTPSA